ncbi:MAG: 16S rRNA (cytosine(1402)-N(4))-methyltransferase RsmH [Deltaproteobacteria bacterium]|jgi:16S rRNA (cytosine1402-N4)-methyltransferase|nr:16S rRNA (cytosine(1402)-N(4))-methyltransferase RsmH [Deltaproteobacteria bacterium]
MLSGAGRGQPPNRAKPLVPKDKVVPKDPAPKGVAPKDSAPKAGTKGTGQSAPIQPAQESSSANAAPIIAPNPGIRDFKPDEWSLAFGHIPVLPGETLEALNIKEKGFYVDLTMGGGGHSRLILSKLGPKGRLLALDKDPETLSWAAIWGQGDPRLIIKRASFDQIDSVLAELGLGPADGLLADLGLSSRQLFSPGRGFSWQNDESLDMRLDPDNEVTAFDIVNHWPEKQLTDLIQRLAEERSGARLTKAILAERAKNPVKTTRELAELVKKVLWRPGHHAHFNLATKVFMGLRVAVNQEMEALATLLRKAPGCLNPGGHLVVIAFHSLEDRQVKQCFASREGQKIWKNMFKKPVTPSENELSLNRRARSAKMRVGELLKQPENK